MNRSRDNLPHAISLNVTIAPQSAAGLQAFIREVIESTVKETVRQAPAPPAVPLPAEPRVVPAAPASQSAGTELQQADRLKAADLRTEILLGKIPEGAGLLIDGKLFARLLQISYPTLNRLRQTKAVPEPVRIRGAVRWRLSEILEWIEADCPPQHAWKYEEKMALKKRGR